MWFGTKRIVFKNLILCKKIVVFQKFSTLITTLILTALNLALNSFLCLARLLRIFVNILNQSFSKRNDISPFMCKH